LTAISPVLQIEHLTIAQRASGQVKGRVAVDDISLSVGAGEVLALIGESGSGKTTLALTALGQIRPGLVVRSGRVMMAGTEMLSAPAHALRGLRGRQVAYVAQSAAAAFNPRLRLDTQVTEPARVHHSRPMTQALARAHALYARLDLPTPQRIGARFPHEVSGGQLQRFMIAMGLAEDPALLVCDEPTSALDVTTQVEVLRALKLGIAQQPGTAALFVSHDLAVVAQIADRIAVLRGGKLVELGATRDVLERPAQPYTRELLAACRHWDRFGAFRRPMEITTRPLLQLDGISAGFDRAGRESFALQAIDLRVARGRILGVIGESGSGKSTLARVIAGLHPPKAGRIQLDGIALAPTALRRSPAERRRMQLVFQMADTALNTKHSVGRILGRVLHFYTNLDKAAREARIAELLAMVKLPAEYAARRPDQLSGGEKQRVNLARALAATPDVLICDEITSALDTIVARHIVALIDELRERLGLAVILISHDLATVASLADDVMVLRHGRVVETGPTEQVLAHPKQEYTKLLARSVPELRVGWLEEVGL
jgi:peptide/nickel transport system ATP-binding protein